MVDVLIFGARAYGWASVVRYLQAGTAVGSGKWGGVVVLYADSGCSAMF